MNGGTPSRAPGILKAAGIIVVAGLIAAAVVSPETRDILDPPDPLPERMQAFGALAPLAFIGLFVVASFLFIPPTAMVIGRGRHVRAGVGASFWGFWR